MSSLRNADLEAAYRELLRSAAALGVNVGNWDLVYGEVRPDTARLPWEIVDGEAVVVELGMTRRDAFNSLKAMQEILAAVNERRPVAA